MCSAADVEGTREHSVSQERNEESEESLTRGLVRSRAWLYGRYTTSSSPMLGRRNWSVRHNGDMGSVYSLEAKTICWGLSFFKLPSVGMREKAVKRREEHPPPSRPAVLSDHQRYASFYVTKRSSSVGRHAAVTLDIDCVVGIPARDAKSNGTTRRKNRT